VDLGEAVGARGEVRRDRDPRIGRRAAGHDRELRRVLERDRLGLHAIDDGGRGTCGVVGEPLDERVERAVGPKASIVTPAVSFRTRPVTAAAARHG
jgi:hypothetical protein